MIRRSLFTLAMMLVPVSAFAVHQVTPDTYGSYPFDVTSVLVATNGSNFLTLFNLDSNYRAGNVYGSIADVSGNVITPVPFLVAADSRLAALFPLGSGYLALFYHTTVTDSGLRAVTLSGEGAVQSTVNLGSIYARSFFFNGRNLLLVGLERQGLATIISPDGHIVREAFMIANSPALAVTTAGFDFLIASMEADKIYLQRIGSDGTAITPRKVVVAASNANGLLAVASVADSVMLAWDSGVTRRVISIVSTNLDGNVTGATTLDDRPPDYFGYDRWSGLSLIPVRSSYLLLAQASAGGLATLFSRTAQIQSRPTLIGGGSAAAASGSIVYAAGLTYSGAPPASFTATPLRVDEQGIYPYAPQAIATSLRVQTVPRAASDGLDHLLTWTDLTREAMTRSIIRLSPNGSPLERSQTDLAATLRSTQLDVYENNPPYDPKRYRLPPPQSVAFGRSVYLVVWGEGATVKGQLVSRSGSTLGNPFLIGSGGKRLALSDQAIAWDGQEFRVIWAGDAGAASAAVTEDGQVSAPTPGLSSIQPQRIIWDGHRFVVAFMLLTYAPGPIHGYVSSGVGLYRLAPDGTPMDFKRRYPWAPALYGFIYSWHLASSGTESLLLADEGIGFGSRVNFFTTVSSIIHADGPDIQIDPPQIVFEWFDSTMSDVTWDGARYVMSWAYPLLPSTEGSRNPGRGWAVTIAKSAHGERPPLISAATTAGVEALGITANLLGSIAVVSEPRTSGDVSRLRTYTEDDMRPLPKPPPSPQIVSVIPLATKSAPGSQGEVSGVVTWTVEPGSVVSGFLVEAVYPRNGGLVTLGYAGPDDRSFTFRYAIQVRVRAFNAGGLSEPSAALYVESVRRRGARH